MSNFTVGQKVVCIANKTNHSWRNDFDVIIGPNKSEVVEIIGVNRDLLSFKEYPVLKFPFFGFGSEFFRPLAEEGIEEMMHDALMQAKQEFDKILVL